MRRISLVWAGFCCASAAAVPPAPVADPGGLPKSRYISMSVPSNGGAPTALRVTLTSLMHPNPPGGGATPPDFTAFEGEHRWVGPPVFATENDNDPTPFIAAPLQCTPYYHDWSPLGLFHVYGDAIVPSSIFDVAVYDQSCAAAEDGCVDVSGTLQINTARFGDTVPPFDMAGLNLGDYGSLVDKMRRLQQGTISKAFTQMYGDVISPEKTVNVWDGAFDLNAFFSHAYPLAGPSSCSGMGIARVQQASRATQRGGATTKVFLTPVPTKGTLTYPAGTSIEGQNLTAPTGGFTAFLNVQIQDWNPTITGAYLRAVQVQVDAASFLGAAALPPDSGEDVSLASLLLCNTTADCRNAFGEFGTNCIPTFSGRFCTPVYVAQPFQGFVAPEHVFDNYPGTNFRLIADNSPTGPIVFAVGGPLNGESAPLDDGERKYLGTIALDIPPQATGHRYTVRVRMGDETTALAGEDTFVDVPIVETFPAVLDIGTQSLGLDFDRCRFLSFVLGHAGEQMAIRVKLVSLHHVSPPYTGGPSIPFTSFEGQYRWVGPPAQYTESSASGTPFFASNLQCTPHYQDWASAGYLHVTGSAIVPSSQYDVQFVPASCMGNEDTCADISAPMTLATTRWTDVEAPFGPAAAGQPDFADISALVNKFKSTPGAPIKARALLAGDDAFGNISPGTMSLDLSFTHISAAVDAFRGKPYPFAVEACP